MPSYEFTVSVYSDDNDNALEGAKAARNWLETELSQMSEAWVNGADEPIDGLAVSLDNEVRLSAQDVPVGECEQCGKLVYPDGQDAIVCENCGKMLIIVPTADRE
jgi:hypothetical protein